MIVWPDRETDEDLLQCSHLVETVVSIVNQDDLLPATIGIYGDWGSGKSSLLKMVRARFDGATDVQCIAFNGWLFEGYEDAKSAIMGSILDEIQRHRTLEGKAKDLIVKLAKRVDWMRLATAVGRQAIAFAAAGPAGLAVNQVLTSIKSMLTKGDLKPEELTKFLKEAVEDQDARRSIREFSKEFEELLKETKIKTLLVFIDDLDRCNPDTIIETLEAIRLFLFVPRTAFIIGADERHVKSAVRRRFPELPGDGVDVGRDYLEKLIQFPIRIPPVGRCDLEAYINFLFAQSMMGDKFSDLRKKALERTGTSLDDVIFGRSVAREVLGEVPAQLDDALLMAERLAPVLTVNLGGNPRQTKRFLNTLLMRHRMAECKGIDLRLQVLAKLMLLEYFRGGLFKRLADLQAEASGKPTELAQLEAYVRKADKAEKEPEVSISTWLADRWVSDWLASDPPISGLDLRPYFYVARDSLGPLAATMRRMSPAAQDVLTSLISGSDGFRANGCEQFKTLSPVDKQAVFEAVAERSRHQEDSSEIESSLKTLVELAIESPDLAASLVPVMSTVRDQTTAGALVPLIARLQDKRIAAEILGAWARSDKPGLAELSKRVIGRLPEKR